MSLSVSVPERIAFGRPVDEDEIARIRVAPRPATALVGRILIAVIFLMSGSAKLADPSGTLDHMQQAGIPAANVLFYVAAFAEILGGIALMTGCLTRLAGIGLAIYLVITTLVFHQFWAAAGAEQTAQLVNFTKNVAILGGLFMLIANGAGRYSIDASVRHPIDP